MKVAFTAKGSGPEAEVDSRFGRARRFVIIDTETGGVEAVDNRQSLDAAQGAGIQAAGSVVSKGVGAVVTGHCGPKAFRTLSAGNVKVFVGATGTVGEALEKFKNGELKEAQGADVEGHW
jgi:predicted Fe-Mo cluster-binding NifX family protein